MKTIPGRLRSPARPTGPGGTPACATAATDVAAAIAATLSLPRVPEPLATGDVTADL